LVATCANPACNRSFTNLHEGRLHLLSPADTASLRLRLIDYCYWLCPDCAACFTIVREADRVRVRPQWVVKCKAPGPLGSAYAK